MSWTKIGGPADSLAIFGNCLAALTPNKQAVYMRDPSGTWKSIGGPAYALIGGGWDLYAVAPGTGDLWCYDGSGWTNIGEHWVEQTAGIGNAIYGYGKGPPYKVVVKYDRYLRTWKEIGTEYDWYHSIGNFTASETLIGGGSKLYLAIDSNNAILEYSRYRKDWHKIGGPGSMWAGVGGTVYGLTPDKTAVYRYNGTPESWTKVGGPAETLIGGWSVLYAIQPGTRDLWRYRGSGKHWDKVGSPGTGWVAVGRTIYGMTTDKKEVWQMDDANTESKRLRNLLYNIYDGPSFGNRVVRGLLVKRMFGETLAEHCADVCFQPLSTLKLLPYLHAIIEIDKGQATLGGTSLSWVEPKTGPASVKNYASCLDASDPKNKLGSGIYKDALPTMMWESHGRTLDALLTKYGPVAITERAQSLGLKQTEMYFGCKQPDGRDAPWADNISTLLDLAKLFEGVESLTFVKKDSSRVIFQLNMINLVFNPGASYTSPITGRTTGPYNTELLRPIVAREAGPAKAGIVNQFMQHVAYRGKGGSGGPSSNEVGESDFLEVTLPFKENSKITPKKFLVGWYIYQRKSGSTTVEQPEKDALQSFIAEIHTLPIRMALETW